MRLAKIKAILMLKGAEFLNMPVPETIIQAGGRGRVGKWCADKGYKRAIIIASKSIVKYGVIDKLINSLKKENIEYFIYIGVTPNPTFKSAKEATELGKKNEADVVIVIGGGSPIDCSKLAAAAIGSDKKLKDLVGMLKAGKGTLPIVAIPTTAGTGSDVTAAAVISDEENHTKHIMLSPKIVPSLAILDSETMETLPKHVIAETAFDALDHAIEAYISGYKNNKAEKLAEEAIVAINKVLKPTYDGRKENEGYEELLIASYKAGLAFNKCSLGYAHAFGHRLTELYDYSHGKTLGILLPNILEFSKDAIEDKLARLAVICDLGKALEDNKVLADKFIQRIIQLRKEVGLAEKCTELKKEDYDHIIKAAFKEANSSYAIPKYMTYDEAVELLDKIR